MAMRRSESPSRPKSPCIASMGCMTAAGLPVLLSVAAILLPICQFFPTPAITIFPLRSMVSSRAWMAALKVSSSCWLIAAIPFCSMVNVFLACAIKSMRFSGNGCSWIKIWDLVFQFKYGRAYHLASHLE